MTKEKVRCVDEAMLANDINSNWQAISNIGFYACGNDRIVKEGACQFSLKLGWVFFLRTFFSS